MGGRRYVDAIDAVANAGLDVVHDVLVRAELRRARTLASLVGGVRLAGLDALLGHLNAVATDFNDVEQLKKLVPIIKRVRADVETAIEATLSGYVSVALDAMRDVMEIEGLVRDFTNTGSRLGEWLALDDRARWKKFSPAKVRERLYGPNVDPTTPEALDYRGHSQALHVSPEESIFFQRGWTDEGAWGGDEGFWEIFEHARRALMAFHAYAESTVPGGHAANRLANPPEEIIDAWRRTQEMQAMWLALIRAAMEQSPADESEGGPS